MSTQDAIFLALGLICLVLWASKGWFWGSHSSKTLHDARSALQSIPKRMEETGADCIIFFGSQTGTAENFASRFAKEAKKRYGLQSIVADLQGYDYQTLSLLPDGKTVVFVLSTYGEGEPTDNAVEFLEFVTAQTDTGCLDNLNYAIFGLGNTTYEFFNAMARKVDKTLQSQGAVRIGSLGEGDDGEGTLEEDYLAWKEPVLAKIAEKLDLAKTDADKNFQPSFRVIERPDLSNTSPTVFLGEHSKAQLQGSSTTPFSSQNPFIATAKKSVKLFNSPDRNCLHLDVDLEGSGIIYETGDHIAVWPMNSDMEVTRFLSTLGLLDKRHTVIEIESAEPGEKVHLPSPTTYDALARYYMDICGPVSRQFVSTLAQFAPEGAKSELSLLGNDKEYFSFQVSSRCINIAQLLESAGQGKAWSEIPFSILIEGLSKFTPRYYSISSSALEESMTASITAVVESKAFADRQEPFLGVATNYLLALKRSLEGDISSSLTHSIGGPRDSYLPTKLPIHIRKSKFRLPATSSTPVIMVGAGTGVAPFRAFVRERAHLAKSGETIGRTLLFFGCRTSTQDFIYRKEWEVSCVPIHWRRFIRLR